MNPSNIQFTPSDRFPKNSSARELRARWRVIIILGMNLLVLISIMGYMLIIHTSLDEFKLPVDRLLVFIALALGLTTLAGEWLFRRALRNVITPLNQLREGTHTMAAGDYGYRVRIFPGAAPELVALEHNFNSLAAQLTQKQKQLDAYTNEVQELVDQRARELSHKTLQLEAMARLSNKLVSILDPRALLAELVTLIQQQFKLYHVAVLLVDEETGQVVPSATLRPVTLPELSLRNGMHSVVAWVAQHGTTLYVPDVSQEPRYYRSPDLSASQSELTIPLKFADQVIGVLNLEADHKDAFSKDDIDVLESLADDVAVAIHNAQGFNALEIANRDLAQATLQANQANTLKSRFLFNASYKLREPLNAIIGNAETMLSRTYGELPREVFDHQRHILENGRVLQALVEDMIDLSSLETGYLQLEREWVDLLPVLEEVLNATRALHMISYPDHTLDLRLDRVALKKPLPPVWVDLKRLRYILFNLTSNAVKFTESGEIVLCADFDDVSVLIHIRDTGPGIDAEDHRYLFEPFQQARGSTVTEIKGTGLGLPVSRLLAMRHGGDLTVESILQQGSTFTLNLPRHPEGASPLPKTE